MLNNPDFFFLYYFLQAIGREKESNLGMHKKVEETADAINRLKFRIDNMVSCVHNVCVCVEIEVNVFRYNDRNIVNKN